MAVTTAPGPEGRTIRIDDEHLAPYREAAARGPESSPSRLAFAAAHVVVRPSYRELAARPGRPGTPEQIVEHVDWDATAAVRRHLDACGFGVAEAMDTAQRFALGWAGAEMLIRECGRLGLHNGFIAGAGVDHLPEIRSVEDLVDGVVHQARIIQGAGGLVIVLPMVWLAREGAGADVYVDVYREIFARLDGPLFVHWLGEMFLPELRGYFPEDSFDRVMALDPGVVRGCKLSLLDAQLELRVRRQIAERGQLVLTGDDLHFARLILGGDPEAGGSAPAAIETEGELAGRRVPLGDFSHALLGVFDGIAAPAGLALRLLSQGDGARYLALMEPCEELGRHLFEPPTRHYKAGLVFLAWLNGRQDELLLIDREEQSRDLGHYLRAAQLAAACGALSDARLAAERLRQLVAG